MISVIFVTLEGKLSKPSRETVLPALNVPLAHCSWLHHVRHDRDPFNQLFDASVVSGSFETSNHKE